MLRPKQKRAMLTIMLLDGKLLRRLPFVREPKVRNPERAITRQKTREMKVERWTTMSKRVRVGVRREVYIKSVLW